MYFLGLHWNIDNKRKTKTAANLTVTLMHLMGLVARVRRRRALADTFECLRLYGERITIGTRGAAATLAVASLTLFHVTVQTWSLLSFTRSSWFYDGTTTTLIFFVFVIVQQVQWSVIFVLMLYPMVVVGSLSADLRWDCSRAASRRLRQSSSSLDKKKLGIHEVIVLVVLCALVSPSLHLSHSLVRITRSDPDKTAPIMAIVGIHFFLNLLVLSFSCQWFSFKSGTIKQVLHIFLLEAESLNTQESQEVRGWPGRCTPRGTGSTCARLLAALLFELAVIVMRLICMTGKHRIALRSVGFVLSLFRAVGLIGAARRRRVRADVLECLRLYGARLPLGARGAAATLALVSVALAQTLVYWHDVVTFEPVFAAEMGSANSVTFSVMFLLQQLQWSVATVLMLYPMVVVGSFSADLRRDCSRTAALRLKHSSSSTDKKGLGPHVRANSLRQDLQAFLVKAVSVHSEADEVSEPGEDHPLRPGQVGTDDGNRGNTLFSKPLGAELQLPMVFLQERNNKASFTYLPSGGWGTEHSGDSGDNPGSDFTCSRACLDGDNINLANSHPKVVTKTSVDCV
ncbi:Casparian strip membrane protein 6 [Frankliniella fusca]|uniref:Casparian strip membrane protein 6 n=1 Tax=Frankliniella fusca TaxID=407009 RepID=A0AAE1HIT7_9NEOP|nr:Casparian strip membrane protein 6 [Frankliniella fusca]